VHAHAFTGSPVNTGNNNVGHVHQALTDGDLRGISNSDRGGGMGWVWGGGGYGNRTLAHYLTGGQSANHIHTVTAAGTVGNTGGGQAHENMQPFVTCFMWRRTA